MQALSAELESWLRNFSKAVRARDFASARSLFHDDVVAFGTVCPRATGLRALAARQWKAVWPNTRGFDFDYPSALALREAALATVLARWSSTGIAGDGATFKRRGRATIVVRKTRSGWKAVHTHFSLNPAQG